MSILGRNFWCTDTPLSCLITKQQNRLSDQARNSCRGLYSLAANPKDWFWDLSMADVAEPEESTFDDPTGEEQAKEDNNLKVFRWYHTTHMAHLVSANPCGNRRLVCNCKFVARHRCRTNWSCGTSQRLCIIAWYEPATLGCVRCGDIVTNLIATREGR